MKTVLAIAPHFPSPAESCDGQSNYITALTPMLSEMGNAHIKMVTLRFGDQPTKESGAGWTVYRIEPLTPLPDIFSLYLPEYFEKNLRVLKSAAMAHAQVMGPSTPIWCHGYETGGVVDALSTAGHHVVAVLHYSVGVETLHDLALGDDDVRRNAFDTPWASAIGRIWPNRIRSVGVRWASRAGYLAQHIPLPGAIRTQFAKLNLERCLVRNASKIVAVGPSFEKEIHALYPCTSGRSVHVIAGSPTQIPAPVWPTPIQPSRRRIVMVGRPTGQKGWDYACAAFRSLEPEETRCIDLVLIGGLGKGNGPYSSYSTQVANDFAKLSFITVHNLGALDHSSTLSHMAAADLLLFPSVFEPLGLVLLEAIASGCCVLASDAAGPSDLLDEPWGISVPFGIPETRVQALTDGLRQFLTWSREDLDERSKMAKAKSELFTWRQCASVHLKALSGA